MGRSAQSIERSEMVKLKADGTVETVRLSHRMWLNPHLTIRYYDTVKEYQKALRLRMVEASRWTFHNNGAKPKPEDLGPMPWPTPAVAAAISGPGKSRTKEDYSNRRQRIQNEAKIAKTGVIGVVKRGNLWEATVYIPFDNTQDKRFFLTRLEAATWRNERATELYPHKPWYLCDLDRIRMEEEENSEKFVDSSTV